MDNLLTGEIPSSFGNLSSLTNLILLTNSLRGPISDRLGELPNLLNLQIGLNNFVGEIPSSLLNSSSLIVLGLAGNNLSGSIANASQLARVDFSNNNFTGYIPSLGNLPSIQVLNLEINELVSGGEPGMDFITSLANSTQLQVFSVATNRLTEYGIGEGLSTKGDVYSFGILMLEIFTKKKPTDEMFTGEMDLQRWVSMELPNQVMDIMDRGLLGNELKSESFDCVVGVLEIGLMCARKSPDTRPSMREVSMMKKKIRSKLLN
ncbi:putative LRR receptor-like serine/threonine-protein kinase [Camellia lanceoleosa]|uniref:LRR receptor-like serine/threonine-protein kinase n=1 Tax=Camellia lanceoleosa TaxID=1840588 RepID=A0ACC0HK14_9ERIC|nr:putative LRR receptor-like serine/threonine-protein kinase [Camellia lanceoleosa]